MWDGWKNYVDMDKSKRYELMVGSKVKVLLVAALTKMTSELSTWEVRISAFAPSAGEHIDYEGVFPNFAEAEAKAWEEAQKAVKIRQGL